MKIGSPEFFAWLKTVPCDKCQQYTVTLVYRKKLMTKPMGTWSLAGVQTKVAATEVDWPWLVCPCGRECELKPSK